jgi:hypothetical protein
MSMHEIEGLVEDSVHLVAKSKLITSVKRDFLFNLYNFQAMYDTGYTHFRLMDRLLDLKFTYCIPLEKHPDYNTHQEYFEKLDIEKNSWLPAHVDNEEASVNAQIEKGGIFLYADAGSEFWERLCKENILPKSEYHAPNKIETSVLIAQLMQEAVELGELRLLNDWYAVLVNFLGIDLGGEDGFPTKFLDFIQKEEINTIRQIGLKNKVFSKKEFRNDWASLETPKLKEIEEEENDVERLYCIKWLLDFKTDEAKIKSNYIKEITPDPKREAKLQIVPDAVERHLGTKNWKLVYQTEYEYGHKWLYHHQIRGEEGKPMDTDLHLYLFLEANTDDLKMLYPKIGIQSGLLLRWQRREVLHLPENIHFLEGITSYITSEEWDTNKSLHYMGGWKFSLKSSEKVLKKHIDNFFEYYQKYAPALIAEFKKPLFKNFEMTVVKAFAYRDKMQQTHRFFFNKVEVYLAYAIHYFENGEIEKSTALVQQAKELIEKSKHPITKEWMATAQSILDGKPKLHELLSFERHYSFE